MTGTIGGREAVIAEIELALARGDFDGAADLAQGLVSSGPKDAEAMALAAWASVRAGDVPDDELRAGLERLDLAVTTSRTSQRALYYRGLVHKRLGNVPAAFRDFARTFQLNPNHTDAEREVRLFAMRVRKGTAADDVAKE